MVPLNWRVKSLKNNILKHLWRFFQNKWVARPVITLLCLYLLYVSFVTHIEKTEIGIARNMMTGKTWMRDGGGFYVRPPWVWVSIIDTRPMRVAVTSGGRGYNAKLVQFDKNYWEDFVKTEGWRFYWFSNRISFNLGYEEEYRGMRDIMRGYAYSAKKYPFVVIIEEYDER